MQSHHPVRARPGRPGRFPRRAGRRGRGLAAVLPRGKRRRAARQGRVRAQHRRPPAAQRPGLRAHGQRAESEPGLQPARGQPAAGPGRPGGRLQAGTARPLRHRLQPALQPGQHAHHALRQHAGVEGRIRRLHAAAQVQPQPRQPRTGHVPRAGQRGLARASLRLRLQPDAGTAPARGGHAGRPAGPGGERTSHPDRRPLLRLHRRPRQQLRRRTGRSGRPDVSRWKKPHRFERNLVVIGAGSAGLVTAYIAAVLKAKVTLIEKHRMGGDCLNTGCVPSKALIRSAKFLSQVARAKEFGIREAHAEFDFADVMARVQRVVQAIEPHDSAERYSGLGVEVIAGTAKLVSPWEVDVVRQDGSTQRLSTRSIVITAGGRPFVPPIPGIEETGYLTSDTVWAMRELPRRLVVLGGGPIGAELAQAFARFGARVTLIQQGPRILNREDPEVSELVSRRFRDEGIDVRIEHQAKQFLVENGEKILVAEHGGREVRIPFDAVLVAVGRAANLTGYGLEELGVKTSRTVGTNAFLQTNYPNIYAAGDVAGPFQFTHTAAHQAWYAAVNALFDPFKKFKADYSVIPWATFVDPEVARVGLNEQEAKEKGIPFEISRYDLAELDRAIVDAEAHGFVKVLTVPGKDKILGVTIVGEHAGDLIAEYVLAMKHGIGLNKILGTLHIYPTLAEANKYAAGAWKKAHAPERLLRWVERFHAWRRG
ncbi:MAG: FAD-dependent oxidoreductase [Gammaproteobacteria bacterium]|nr:FAD-dependent oxidoreductase [Gammaproteobacteria bacterium]